ncbi:hypothetical protein DENSPDRAFT_353424 [Dentipellis sp. KUC8613]|nr:hypothetical protein DENSPDRAFT_353424 [Dentipellis sp. KUC8613]
MGASSPVPYGVLHCVSFPNRTRYLRGCVREASSNPWQCSLMLVEMPFEHWRFSARNIHTELHIVDASKHGRVLVITAIIFGATCAHLQLHSSRFQLPAVNTQKSYP